ncbi:MAG: alpha-L-arabinofuranosidase C-terminal domain-containing protein [Bacteroidales bacterium]|nr:alpha-L-arabinofuranosidase C-terminal domain-containing protein [Bacteroidales bacterium]
MKQSLMTVIIIMMSLPVFANQPDSVWVRPDVKNGTRDMQIAYSIDKKHWTHVNCNLFESDYGTWGSEKKLHHPVLSYDGKTYRATFIPNLKNGQIAVTESEDFALWKPQDYPYVAENEFPNIVAKQEKASQDNIIRIPYEGLQNLFNKQMLANQNNAWERDDFLGATEVLKTAKGINATLKVNMNDVKDISPDLMGIFFEDISYAADGGLYAELIQNRDFEYTADDHRGWDAKTAWKLEGEGTTWTIETQVPIHKNNAHYAVLKTTAPGAKLTNEGWDGIPLQKGKKYDFSLFTKGAGPLRVSLVEGKTIIASKTFKATKEWRQQKVVLTASQSADKASLVIEPLEVGSIHLDFISLFPQETFKGHPNGLRKDLAEVIADLKPRFVRFPGGCATHGQGIDNIYHWQATVGELWERQPDMNIWSYHQTRGLGFHEYFQFCEDIGAEPLPVLAAGVPCQNSWKGGAGQQGGLPFEADLQGKPSPYTYMGKPLTMESYLQELLDLIEWANGDAKTSELAKIRAKAGHPKPFNLKYLGIGNEDLISDTFLKRYHFLIEGIQKVHPEITIVGTVGPFWEGSDYEYGWREAKAKNIPIVDEHYYNSINWYFHHRDFYDNYDRKGTKVYLGEWASKGNNVINALMEAAYLANMERNADVVVMSSYAPLLAKEGHTSWNPDLIYFNNKEVKPTANYFVQRAYGQNAGDKYVYSDLQASYTSTDGKLTLQSDRLTEYIDKSVVIDSRTGDIIIKVVSLLPTETDLSIALGEGTLNGYNTKADFTVMAGDVNPKGERDWKTNDTKTITVSDTFNTRVPANSFSIIRIKKNKK